MVQVLRKPILLIFCALPFYEASGQSCPGASEGAIIEVKAFISSDSWSDDRNDLGISGVTRDQVVILSDASICDSLNSIFSDAIEYEVEIEGEKYKLNQMNYLKAGSYYFVYTSYKKLPGIVMLGTVGLYVYDEKLNELGGFAY